MRVGRVTVNEGVQAVVGEVSHGEGLAMKSKVPHWTLLKGSETRADAAPRPSLQGSVANTLLSGEAHPYFKHVRWLTECVEQWKETHVDISYELWHTTS